MFKKFLSKNSHIALNLSVVLLERIIQLVLTIIGVGIIASHITISDNGKYAYAFGLASVFLTISFYAGSELIVPNLSKYKLLQKHILKTGLYLRIFYGLICLIISSLFAFLYIKNIYIRHAFFIFLLGPLVCESLYIYACWFSATGRNVWFSIARNSGAVVRLLVIIYLSRQSIIWLRFEYFAYAYLLEAFTIALVILYAFFTHKHSPKNGKLKIFLLKSMFSDGIWIGVGLTVNYFYIRLDRILLERLVSFKQLGIYSGATQLSDAWINTGVILCGILAPYFIFNCKKYAIALKRLYYTMLGMFIFAVIGSSLIYIFATDIVLLVLHEKYQASIPLFQYISMLSLLIFINQLFCSWWLRQKAYILQIIVWLYGAIFVIGFALYLVPKYELYGMIYALTMGQISMCIGQFLCIKYLPKANKKIKL